jgi:Domain of unknown function (DUF5753)
MPSDESAPAIKALTCALWQAWTKAGPVSYAEFEKMSKRVLGPAQYLPRSTVQGHLTNRGNRRPARWDWVLRFWKVVRVLAREHGINPDSLGALGTLKCLHEAAEAEALLARQLVDIADAGSAGESPLFAAPGTTPGAASFPWEPSAQAAPSASTQPDAVLASIRQRVGQEWWHDYRDVVPDWFETYLSLEPAASRIWVYDTVVVPGLLQTEAYASSTLRLAPFTLPEATIDRIIELRMRRQQIIGQPDGPRVWTILDESALRHQLGDAKVMHRQIAHLIEISKHPNVTIQVIPSFPTIRTTLGYPLTLLRFPVHEVPDVAYFEPLTTALYLHDPVHVCRYTQVLNVLAIEALPPAETVLYLSRLLLEV